MEQSTNTAEREVRENNGGSLVCVCVCVCVWCVCVCVCVCNTTELYIFCKQMTCTYESCYQDDGCHYVRTAHASFYYLKALEMHAVDEYKGNTHLMS